MTRSVTLTGGPRDGSVIEVEPWDEGRVLIIPEPRGDNIAHHVYNPRNGRWLGMMLGWQDTSLHEPTTGAKPSDVLRPQPNGLGQIPGGNLEAAE